MAAKRKKERIVGQYFVWLVGTRNDVYYADGRSNKINAGRHTLGTKEFKTAMERLQKLDLDRAVAHGLAHRSLLEPDQKLITLEEGRQRYEEHVGRPRVVGGTKSSTGKRYRAVFDKFLTFARKEGITVWNHVTSKTIERYAAFLEKAGYAYATQYVELTTIKQAVKFLVAQDLLPPESLIRGSLSKPQGTTTYCWHQQEVKVMLEQCRKSPSLAWREGVIIALACTGLRISELASLRWTDIDRQANMIRLTDESRQPRRGGRKPRETKSGRSRAFPLHEHLAEALKVMPPTKDGLIFHGPPRRQAQARYRSQHSDPRAFDAIEPTVSRA
jgi:site-specific recombinase XerC